MAFTTAVLLYNGPDVPISRGSLSLEDEEWELLLRFATYEAELTQAAFVRAGMPPEGRFAWSATGQWSEPDLPPDAEIREFLHLLRPLILQSEDTYYGRVKNVLARRFDHPKIRKRLELFDIFFDGRLHEGFIQFTAGDLLVNSADTLNLWLNAFEFHRDRNKLSKLHLAMRDVPLSVIKFFCIDMLVAKAEAIMGVAAIVRDIRDASQRGGGWIA